MTDFSNLQTQSRTHLKCTHSNADTLHICVHVMEPNILFYIATCTQPEYPNNSSTEVRVSALRFFAERPGPCGHIVETTSSDDTWELERWKESFVVLRWGGGVEIFWGGLAELLSEDLN